MICEGAVMLKGFAERKGGNLENVNEQPLHLYSLQITLPERSASNTVTCGILVAVSLALASLLPLAHRWHGPTAHVNLLTPGLY